MCPPTEIQCELRVLGLPGWLARGHHTLLPCQETDPSLPARLANGRQVWRKDLPDRAQRLPSDPLPEYLNQPALAPAPGLFPIGSPTHTSCCAVFCVFLTLLWSPYSGQEFVHQSNWPQFGGFAYLAAWSIPPKPSLGGLEPPAFWVTARHTDPLCQNLKL